jgi:hypothetical protein
MAPDAAAPQVLSKPMTFATAGLGGILGWTIVHPANTCAVKMNLLSARLGPGEKLPSFFSFSSKLIKTEGVKGLYAGLGAGCVRQIFYATSRFGLFEVCPRPRSLPALIGASIPFRSSTPISDRYALLRSSETNWRNIGKPMFLAD